MIEFDLVSEDERPRSKFASICDALAADKTVFIPTEGLVKRQIRSLVASLLYATHKRGIKAITRSGSRQGQNGIYAWVVSDAP